ncbi:MAG: peptidase T-like protein [candidate division CPR2 bacterium GW2011_GWC1_39_9]|uniref:Peptidase T-like protein n=1 Tax=candidate division CPR2 bacterium GW2011_GWC2_39_10 TaxID=1618345 RepID=A0A0G0M1I3_UNCC2|nr:MAG: peptidase T-like protein [candidate division CPR2 bacterium GW2011_GWC2_39_10]KKR34551.1 MAG: peptidase T-like protein [candidate division CPR2 bacterium GW2011_GWC1_39_9]
MINKERLTQNFLKLVQIDSESGEEENIISYLKDELKRLGFNSEIDKTGNLVGCNSNEPKLLLLAHVDTVKPGKKIKPIVTEDGIVKTDGSTILGGDNKSGIAAILEILEQINENNIKANLEIAFTVQEETGLIGSANLDVSKIKSKNAINLDGKFGNVDSTEPAIMQFDIVINGKAAHAGLAPENGIDAVKIAANAISEMELGRIDDETTANVGLIKGGAARNIVPEKIIIEAEVRSRNDEKFKKVCEHTKKVFETATKEYGGKIEINCMQRSRIYSLSRDQYIVDVIIKSFQKNGREANFIPSGGITDANNMNYFGIQCVTAGVGGENIHSTEETLKIDDLILGTQIIYDAVKEIAI